MLIQIALHYLIFVRANPDHHIIPRCFPEKTTLLKNIRISLTKARANHVDNGTLKLYSM